MISRLSFVALVLSSLCRPWPWRRAVGEWSLTLAERIEEIPWVLKQPGVEHIKATLTQ